MMVVRRHTIIILNLYGWDGPLHYGSPTIFWRSIPLDGDTSEEELQAITSSYLLQTSRDARVSQVLTEVSAFSLSVLYLEPSLLSGSLRDF